MPEDIINTPIKPEDYSSDIPDHPEDEPLKDPSDNDIDLDDDINIGSDEIDPIGDIGLGDEEFEAELEVDALPETSPEEVVKWTPVPQENGDIRSEHIDGFILRARPLSSKQENKIKYAAQLYKNGKMVENGTIWIDRDVDATSYLQNVSDRILGRLNLIGSDQAEPFDI